MKTFKLSQSKDENLLKITSKKTNYEIKLTDNELFELKKVLGFNFESKEIKTEKQIDWRNLSFDDWMSETKKLNLSYDDLYTHIKNPTTLSESIYSYNFVGGNIKEKTQWVYNQLNPIDWQNLSFPEWFYQTSKLEFDCYYDLYNHYMSDKTSMDKAFKLNSSGYLDGLIDNEASFANSQNYPPTFLPNGSIFILDTETFIKNKSFLSDRTIPFVTDAKY